MSRQPLPRYEELLKWLRLPADASGELLEAYLGRALLAPLAEFMGRPGKGIRGQLVEIGHRLACGRASADAAGTCEALASCIEAIHAGSLIVDDIEDESVVRRGQPALHLRHGIGVALNAGNWLYFLAFKRCLTLDLDEAAKRSCLALLCDEMLRAHCGQALDVGVAIDEVPQARVHDLCLASMRLKSGALTSLALALGAAAAGTDAGLLRTLQELGERLGIALQMFDDLRNLERPDPADPANLKRLEDLYGRRPSWIWAFAAKSCAPKDYDDFVRAVRVLPDESFLLAWLGIHGFARKARAEAHSYLDGAIATLRAELGRGGEAAQAIDRLERLASVIAGSPA